MTKTKKNLESLLIPAHENEEPHRKLMASLEQMSDEDFFQTLVSAGIYDKKGQLRPPYTDQDEPRTGKKEARAKSATRAFAQKTTRQRTPLKTS